MGRRAHSNPYGKRPKGVWKPVDATQQERPFQPFSGKEKQEKPISEKRSSSSLGRGAAALWEEEQQGQREIDDGAHGGYFRALSVRGMQAELIEDAKNAGLDDEANIHNLVEPVLLMKGQHRTCPRDNRQGTAYVDAVDHPDHVGRATYMVSYAWGYKLSLIVNTVSEWCKKKGHEAAKTCVWFCCVCINQHRVQEKLRRNEVVSFEEFEQEFGKRVHGVRHVLALMYPWRSPTYIERSWCIFELFTAKDSNSTLELLMPQDEEQNFQNALLDGSGGANMQECWKLLTGVRLEDAQATSKEDKKNIDLLVQKNSTYKKLNNTVRQLLKEWFVDNAEKQLQVLKDLKGSERCAQACAQVGYFLENMGSYNFVRAIEYYRGGLGMLTETNQLKTVMGVRLLTSIGAIKRRRGEEKGASDTFQVAQEIIDGLQLQDQDQEGWNAKAKLCDEVALVSNQKVRKQKFEEAREIRQKRGTLKTNDGAASLYQFGKFLSSEEATKYFEEAIGILEEIKAIETPLGASILSALANAKRKLKNPREALQDLKKCLDILENTENLFSTVGAGVLSIRAEAEFDLGEWDKALGSYREAQRIRKECCSHESMDGAKMLMGQAKVMLKKDDLPDAVSKMKEASCILDSIHKGDHEKAKQCKAFLDLAEKGEGCNELFNQVFAELGLDRSNSLEFGKVSCRSNSTDDWGSPSSTKAAGAIK